MYFIIVESFVFSGLSRNRCTNTPVRVEIELFQYIRVYILFCGWNYRRFYQVLKGKSEFWEM